MTLLGQGFGFGALGGAGGDIQDLGTWTEQDGNNRITVADTKSTFAGLLNEDVAYLYRDFGADTQGDFDIDFEAEITSTDTGNIVGLCAVSDTVGDRDDMATANDGMVLYTLKSGARVNLWLADYNTDQFDQYLAPETDVLALQYYTFARVGTTLTCTIYSDPTRETVVDTLSITCEAGTKQYVYATLSRGSAGATAINGYTQNFVVS